MTSPALSITAPIVAHDSSIWFSAYASGWGYAAYALTVDTLRAKFGANGVSPQQLLLAFELGRQRLLRAIAQRIVPPSGVRVTLMPGDLPTG